MAEFSPEVMAAVNAAIKDNSEVLKLIMDAVLNDRVEGNEAGVNYLAVVGWSEELVNMFELPIDPHTDSMMLAVETAEDFFAKRHSSEMN
jgi:hypothetical protein